MAARLPADISSSSVSPLSIPGLRLRKYYSQPSLIEEIYGRNNCFRSFLVVYRSDGLNLYARINIPTGGIPAQGFPVVVFLHGYSPDPLDPEYFQRSYYEAWVNAYADAGYIVIMPGYRGHGVVNGKKADGSEYIDSYSHLYLTSPFYAVDVLNLLAGLAQLSALDWGAFGFLLRSQQLADQNNLFLAAHSMGGDVALAVLAVSPCFKAASIWAGVCAHIHAVADFYTRYEINASNPAALFAPAFQEKWEKITSVVKNEPFNLMNIDAANGYFYLENVTAPLILHHGTGDTAVPVEWSLRLYQALKDLGKDTSLYLYDGNNHEIGLNNQHPVAIARDVAFFNQNMHKGSEDHGNA